MPKRYSTYLKERFNARVHKVSVDAGFSCPNKDGRLSSSGCIYCDNRSFSFHNRKTVRPSLKEQIAEGMESARRRYKADKFIIYFQAHTNTYAPLDELRTKYDVIRSFNDVVGLSIATRPDCVGEDILRLIAGYADDYEVWIEYGLQSKHNTTLEIINRQHTYEDFLNAVSATRRHSIKICVHTILGLPGETRDMMMDTAREMRRLRIEGIKIHPLHVVKDTVLEDMHKQGIYKILTLDEYKRLLPEFMDCLWQDTVIQGAGARCPKDILVAPDWLDRANLTGRNLLP